MSEVSKQRLAVDLDAIERHLKPPASPKDPLAELARIVGQDDPFRTLLAEPARPARGEAPEGAARGEAASFAEHLDDADRYPFGGPDNDDEEPVVLAPEPKRARKGFIAVGAVLGVAVIGVAGAMALRGTAGPAGGEPPVIQADRSPSKVLPPNPGGVEIPNQDRQILERGGDRQTKVVSREEQPVDVRQAARIASASGDLIPAGMAGPGAPSSMGPQTAAAAIGIEPKRVRTVSVRPDGTIGASDAARSAPPAAMPAIAAGAPAITSSTTPPASRPRPDTRSTATPGGETPQATPAAAAATPALRPQRVASATPLTAVAALSEPAPQAAATPQPTAAPQATGGGFSVQLTTSGSETEGRTAFKALQQKFAGELGGRAPLIRKHEADGKTVFRVRVGPMGKDEATALCSRLKTAGGQCFVAGG